MAVNENHINDLKKSNETLTATTAVTPAEQSAENAVLAAVATTSAAAATTTTAPTTPSLATAAIAETMAEGKASSSNTSGVNDAVDLKENLTASATDQSLSSVKSKQQKSMSIENLGTKITTTTTTAAETATATAIAPKAAETVEMPTIMTTTLEGEEKPRAMETINKKRKCISNFDFHSTDEECMRLKRRKIKAAGAPKLPLTGYVRYMNDRREILRKEFPNKTAAEHTKIISEEWHNLPEELKAPYVKTAESDRLRYLDELETFFISNPDVLACEIAKSKASSRRPQGNASGDHNNKNSVLKEKTQMNGNNFQGTNNANNNHSKLTKETVAARPSTRNSNIGLDRKRTPTPPPATVTAIPTNSAPPTPAITAPTLVQPVPGEIPIFTNEFLEHNKVVDLELRTLRKSKADLEQQNAVLEKHVENMKFGVLKMTSENDELQEKNRLLQVYLDKLKNKLAQALSGLPLPTEPNGATVDNIDKYMTDLYKMATSNSHGPAALNKAKDIIRKLDLQINLY